MAKKKNGQKQNTEQIKQINQLNNLTRLWPLDNCLWNRKKNNHDNNRQPNRLRTEKKKHVKISKVKRLD